jgi:VanZ family protein
MGEITMLRYRLALLAAGILLLSAPSARAFSLQNTGAGGDDNSSFADPDNQITNSFAQGVRPLDSNEQSMQLGVQQQGIFDPVWWDQSLHGFGLYYQMPQRQMRALPLITRLPRLALHGGRIRI